MRREILNESAVKSAMFANKLKILGIFRGIFSGSCGSKAKPQLRG
jgi:hypothetical protein